MTDVVAAGQHRIGAGVAGRLEALDVDVTSVGHDGDAGVVCGPDRFDAVAGLKVEIDDDEVGAGERVEHAFGAADDLARMSGRPRGIGEARRRHEVADTAQHVHGPERNAGNVRTMHPIERLRYVARASEGGSSLMLGEAASALAAFTDDPAALVTACRRLVARQPTYGPIWWLTSSVLCASDAEEAAWSAARAFDRDPTPSIVTDEIPAPATLAVVGWPEQAALALRRRGDLTVLVVAGESKRLSRAFEAYDVDGEVVDPVALGAAVAGSDLVLLEAQAAGPDHFLAASGSLAAALVARHVGRPVWLVAGRGRALPSRLWTALAERIDDERPWDQAAEVVPVALVDTVITPDGRQDAATHPISLVTDCPVAPELFRDLA